MLSSFPRFCLCFCLFLTAIGVLTPTASARQRNYVVGASVNLAGGVNNLPPSNIPGLSSKTLASFYSAHPGILVSSAGANSNLNLSYNFGLNARNARNSSNSNSHALSVSYTSRLASSWRLNIRESLMITDDESTFNAIQGIPSGNLLQAVAQAGSVQSQSQGNAVPGISGTGSGGSNYLFYPVTTNTSTTTNNVSVVMEYILSAESTLSFTGNHNLRRYEDPSRFAGILSNQERYSGGMNYQRRISIREAWNVSYSGSFDKFANFSNSNANSQSVTVGYSNMLTPSLTFFAAAGASDVRSRGANGRYTGYDASLSLQKTLLSNSFAFRFSQNSGTQSGLGSTSNLRSIGANVSRNFKRMTAFVDAAMFDSSGSLGNQFSATGANATSNIGVIITKTFSIHGGIHYQRYGQSIFAFASKRAFVSLRYRSPDLFRVSR